MSQERRRATKNLAEIFSQLKSQREWEEFIEDFFSPSEVLQFEERWKIAVALLEKKTQRAVAESLGVSISKVTRGAQVLKFGRGSFQKLFDRDSKKLT